MNAVGPRHPALEAGLVWLAVCAALAVLLHLGGRLPVGSVLVPVVWLWTPPAVLYFTRRNFAEYGLLPADWRRGLGLGAIASAVILPLFAAGYWLTWGVFAGRALAWQFNGPAAKFAFTSLIVFALPEEVFFRGYLQTLFAKAWPSRRGQDLAIVAAAACFALAHLLPGPQLSRLATFFPGLVLGWLRRRSGGIVAPIVFHALANATMVILEGRL
jgi:membrane protease YdiL (CAAX protease family)